MTDLDIHLASPAEKEEAYWNAWETWGAEADRETWVEERLESPRHERADWWVGTHGGDVVTALGRFDLAFAFRGDVRPGFGVGAVHTHPDWRGRGFATELCRVVGRRSRRRGDAFGLLFTDVAPEFYRRLGYRVVGDRSFVVPDPGELVESGPSASLAPVDPTARLDDLALWYDATFEETDLHLHRSEAYWRANIRETPDHDWYAVAVDDREAGYLRLSHGDDTTTCLELAVPDSTDRPGAVRGLADLAVARGNTALRFDFPPPRSVLPHADEFQRTDEIPMIWPALETFEPDDGSLRDQTAIRLADHF